jgi:hypothetical protein
MRSREVVCGRKYLMARNPASKITYTQEISTAWLLNEGTTGWHIAFSILFCYTNEVLPGITRVIHLAFISSHKTQEVRIESVQRLRAPALSHEVPFNAEGTSIEGPKLLENSWGQVW